MFRKPIPVSHSIVDIASEGYCPSILSIEQVEKREPTPRLRRRSSSLKLERNLQQKFMAFWKGSKNEEQEAAMFRWSFVEDLAGRNMNMHRLFEERHREWKTQMKNTIKKLHIGLKRFEDERLQQICTDYEAYVRMIEVLPVDREGDLARTLLMPAFLDGVKQYFSDRFDSIAATVEQVISEHPILELDMRGLADDLKYSLNHIIYCRYFLYRYRNIHEDALRMSALDVLDQVIERRVFSGEETDPFFHIAHLEKIFDTTKCIVADEFTLCRVEIDLLSPFSKDETYKTNKIEATAQAAVWKIHKGRSVPTDKTIDISVLTDTVILAEDRKLAYVPFPRSDVTFTRIQTSDRSLYECHLGKSAMLLVTFKDKPAETAMRERVTFFDGQDLAAGSIQGSIDTTDAPSDAALQQRIKMLPAQLAEQSETFKHAACKLKPNETLISWNKTHDILHGYDMPWNKDKHLRRNFHGMATPFNTAFAKHIEETAHGKAVSHFSCGTQLQPKQTFRFESKTWVREPKTILQIVEYTDGTSAVHLLLDKTFHTVGYCAITPSLAVGTELKVASGAPFVTLTFYCKTGEKNAEDVFSKPVSFAFKLDEEDKAALVDRFAFLKQLGSRLAQLKLKSELLMDAEESDTDDNKNTTRFAGVFATSVLVKDAGEQWQDIGIMRIALESRGETQHFLRGTCKFTGKTLIYTPVGKDCSLHKYEKTDELVFQIFKDARVFAFKLSKIGGLDRERYVPLAGEESIAISELFSKMSTVMTHCWEHADGEESAEPVGVPAGGPSMPPPPPPPVIMSAPKKQPPKITAPVLDAKPATNPGFAFSENAFKWFEPKQSGPIGDGLFSQLMLGGFAQAQQPASQSFWGMPSTEKKIEPDVSGIQEEPRKVEEAPVEVEAAPAPVEKESSPPPPAHGPQLAPPPPPAPQQAAPVESASTKIETKTTPAIAPANVSKALPSSLPKPKSSPKQPQQQQTKLQKPTKPSTQPPTKKPTRATKPIIKDKDAASFVKADSGITMASSADCEKQLVEQRQKLKKVGSGVLATLPRNASIESATTSKASASGATINGLGGAFEELQKFDLLREKIDELRRQLDMEKSKNSALERENTGLKKEVEKLVHVKTSVPVAK